MTGPTLVQLWISPHRICAGQVLTEMQIDRVTRWSRAPRVAHDGFPDCVALCVSALKREPGRRLVDADPNVFSSDRNRERETEGWRG